MVGLSHCVCGQPHRLNLLYGIRTLNVKFSSHTKMEIKKNLLWDEQEMLCINTGITLTF